MRYQQVVSTTCVGILFLALNAAAADKPALPDNVEIHLNLPYRPDGHPSCVLDLAVPKRAGDKLRPAVVIIHGGGWIEGDKSSFSSVEHRIPANIIELAAKGYVAATINYRLAGVAPYPAAVWDCQCAIRWLRAHAQEYHLDPDRIAVWGNSAGGHLALMLAVAEGQIETKPDAPWADQSARVQAAISDSGPLDLVAQYDHGVLRVAVEKFLAGPPEGDRRATYERASPSSYVTKNSPPLLLIYGEDDGQVPIETADRYVLALQQAGHPDVSYQRLAGVDHCPHSIQKIPSADAFFHEFLKRVLVNQNRFPPQN